MKNLFKNLMLVAVAAMAFAACSQDVNEVNKVEKKTVISGVLNIENDDTRSGFVGKNEAGTAYVSEWDGGEVVSIYADSYDVKTTTIDEDGNFTVQFDGVAPNYLTICSPATSWSDRNYIAVPEIQTPRENSVDPAAHILKAQNVEVVNGSASAKMDHAVAYGKMTIKGVDFAIDKVKINLIGTFYGYDRNYTYTLNAGNVKNNTFWFATDVMDVVTKFTVTAYDAEGSAVAKTVDVAAAGKTLAFNYGRVSTFSVSGLEVPAEKFDYTSAYVSNVWGTTDMLVTFATAEGEETLHVNFYGRSFDGNSIATGSYTIGDGIYGYGIYLGDYFGDGECKSAYYGNLVVSVDDGCYVMVFTDLKDVYSKVLAERITFKGTIDGMNTPSGSTPDPEPDPEPEPTPDPEPDPDPAPEGTGTESNPYVYACNVEYQSLFGGYYTLSFTCETEGSFNLCFETQNADLNSFVSSSLSKFYSPQLQGYLKSWAPDESTINIEKIADKTYSVDIMISTFDGKVYYTCPSVVFP